MSGFLAGGLKPDNVKQAIEEVQPFGVDVCSGVIKAHGKLDRKKLYDFINRFYPRNNQFAEVKL